MRKLLQILLLPLPWPLRRGLMNRLFGYEIHSTARIGWAWIDPDALQMGPGSRIGHLTVCKGVAVLSLGPNATIGRGNWITGFPRGHARHFAHQPDRRPELRIGAHAAITHRHIIDCTNCVTVGDFSTIAGFGTQILTHSIDLAACRQSSAPVHVGRYCFVGTACVIVAGAELPDCSILGAASLLDRAQTVGHCLYLGVPARPTAAVDPTSLYFSRASGFVD
jgi:acetyltransferase-like isoleucine patch superfamily enzyme